MAESGRESGKQMFQIPCASRGFHAYREIWRPKLGEKLVADQEINNVHDPFAISLETKVAGKLTESEIVGHIPREISRFCHYFINYGGKLEMRVTSTRYRPSPIPTGGLEIPILLIVIKGDSTKEVFEEMETLVKSYYLEPDQIPAVENEEDEEEFDIEEVDFVPDTEENSEEENNVEASDIVPETQTQVIPETQNDQNTQIVPDTQDIIVIDD